MPFCTESSLSLDKLLHIYNRDAREILKSWRMQWRFPDKICCKLISIHLILVYPHIMQYLQSSKTWITFLLTIKGWKIKLKFQNGWHAGHWKLSCQPTNRTGALVWDRHRTHYHSRCYYYWRTATFARPLTLSYWQTCLLEDEKKILVGEYQFLHFETMLHCSFTKSVCL